jgi:hypothetical protein
LHERKTAKLREHKAMLDGCIEKVIGALREAHPEMGRTVAIDGSDMRAYANGHKHVGNKNGPLRTKYAGPDAGWGHRSSISTCKGGALNAYNLHAAICTQTELPLAWTVRAANEPEQAEVPGLLDSVIRRGFGVGVAVMDKGYDGEPMHAECESRNIRPVIALKETPAVQAGKHKPAVRARRVDVRRIGREARREQVAVPGRRVRPGVAVDQGRPAAPAERGFGRLKTDWGLTPLRVRRIQRVRLHADLTILAQLASALAATRDT